MDNIIKFPPPIPLQRGKFGGGVGGGYFTRGSLRVTPLGLFPVCVPRDRGLCEILMSN